MSVRAISLVLLSVIFFSMAVHPTETKEIVSFKRNMDTVFREWSCRNPKRRLVYLEDEFDDYDPSALYLPHALVVSRCEKTVGCCKPGQICSPVEKEETSFSVEMFSRGKKYRKVITLINHVKCQCQSSVHDSPR